MFFHCLRHSVAHFRVSHTAGPREKSSTFKLADIGEDITECEVIRWSVARLAPSAQVASFDPFCEAGMNVKSK
ncbi:hypothetical protein GGX14DRAFT_576377 [Mycena pura]|uniref:Uncharacterized protein n=1 Tax=Mycena pura TaxID=153505 RepID=A0AAD6UTR0_9AGAR|nr:hypothetical protein GGX14DRAFT_576377 [Mycena pura]